MDAVYDIKNENNFVEVIWEYEKGDDDMREVGEEYKIISEGKIVIKCVEDIRKCR